MDSEAFKKYENLLKSAKQELYQGCEDFPVLNAIVESMRGRSSFVCQSGVLITFGRFSKRCFQRTIVILKIIKCLKSVEWFQIRLWKKSRMCNNCVLLRTNCWTNGAMSYLTKTCRYQKLNATTLYCNLKLARWETLSLELWCEKCLERQYFLFFVSQLFASRPLCNNI